MKKLLALTLTTILLITSLMLTSCDAAVDIVEQYVPELKEYLPEFILRHTVTEEEWNQNAKLENFSGKIVLTFDDESIEMLFKCTKNAYMLDESYYVTVNDSNYYLEETESGWVAYPGGFQGINVLTDTDFNDFKYDESKKAYVNKDFEEGKNEVIYKFENGVLVYAKSVALLSEESENALTIEIIITDVGTTVIKLPEYTFAE